MNNGLIFILGCLLPKGYSRESFAGKQANTLDQSGIVDLSRLVAQEQNILGIPGAAFGLVQDGKVVFADGCGSKELAKREKPDGEPLFIGPRPLRSGPCNRAYS